jgi:outer membrane protein assembly factor BamB
MSSRTITTIVLAVVLMLLVMAVATFLAVTGVAGNEKWAISENWAQPAPAVSSMKVTNLTGAGKTDLFVQAGNQAIVLDASGREVFNQTFPGTVATSLGDVDGDGIQEIIAYYGADEGSAIAAVKAVAGRPVWQTRMELSDMGAVGRAAVVDFDGTGRAGVVVGDMRGKLTALADNGQVRWRYDMQSSSDLRGLDSIVVGKKQLVVAADMDGKVAALDGKGALAWSYAVPGGLRRLRTEELIGPGKSAVLLGGEDGTLIVLDGGTGQVLWTANLGQAVTEIRLAELDGDPGTHELVAGGKRNGVWAYSQTGARLFAATVGGDKTKITEVAAMDADGSGKDVVAIGDDSGVVTFFDAKGLKLTSLSYAAPINRMATGKIAGQRQFLVADASQVRAVTLSKQTAPFWYSPLLAGLLACAVIAVGAYFIGSMRPAPPLQISAEQMTVEAQKARRVMLHESINDLKRMQAAGEIPSDAYLARLKDLRGQLADAEANLIKLGVPLQAETITCPHCGGSLELGTDRCDYCGQTVLT